MEPKYTFVNGEEVTENLDSAALHEMVIDIVMSNLQCSFRWKPDNSSTLITEG